jgi:hypothetical protein
MDMFLSAMHGASSSSRSSRSMLYLRAVSLIKYNVTRNFN